MNDKYWTTSLNPLKVKGGGYHCTKCSPGCDHCWAEGYNKRFGNGRPYDNSPAEFVLDEKVLQQPLHWRKPRVVFVCDLCDLFHVDVPFELIHKIWDVIKGCPQHTFLTLTKRARRMTKDVGLIYKLQALGWAKGFWEHLYPGLTICNQAELDEKATDFLQIPGHKWLSIEPMLGRMQVGKYLRCNQCGYTPRDVGEQMDHQICVAKGGKGPQIQGVIVGGESGPGARPMHPDWVRSVRDQCAAAGVPFFFKQWGAWIPTDHFGKCKWESKRTAILPHQIKHLMGDATPETGMMCYRVGKKAAGRLLDGREHNELAWKV